MSSVYLATESQFKTLRSFVITLTICLFSIMVIVIFGANNFLKEIRKASTINEAQESAITELTVEVSNVKAEVIILQSLLKDQKGQIERAYDRADSGWNYFADTTNKTNKRVDQLERDSDVLKRANGLNNYEASQRRALWNGVPWVR